MKKTLTALVAASWMLMVGTVHAALYFGEDENLSRRLTGTLVPLTSVVNSSSAEATFKSRLTGTGTETFETVTGTAPYTLTFPGSSGDVTAALAGGDGVVRTLSQPGTNIAGRYSVPSSSSRSFFEVAASVCDAAGCRDNGFEITFNQDVAAFGFYGIDIGDFEGELSIEFVRADNSVVGGGAVQVGNSFNLDGSVLFFGFVADTFGDLFRSVRFLTTDSSGDTFAFDNMTVGTYCQTNTAVNCDSGGGGGGEVPSPVPEPTSLGLALAALAALRLSRRRFL